MKWPLGYTRKEEILTNNPDCLIHRSLYGLKQASRQWFQKFFEVPFQKCFVQTNANYSMFIQATNSYSIALLVYVDDIVIAGNNTKAIQKLKVFMDTCFKLKDLGILKYFLGLEIAKS